MSACNTGCGCSGPPKPAIDPLFRRILWIALVLNGAMFFVEFGGGWFAQSVALIADSMDFLGDSINYGISLVVLGMVARRRAQAALFKGVSLGLVGLWVVGNTLWHLSQGTIPKAELMGAIGLAALAVNAGVALSLYRYREGDANMQSIWLCSRNDAIGNVAVLAAAAGVWGSNSGWPDLAVAALLAYLPLSAALRIIRQARGELTTLAD